MTDTDLAARIGKHIAALTSAGSRHSENPSGVQEVLEYLRRMLEGFGYQVHEQHYGAETHQINLTVLTGTDHSMGILDLGAHWDTVAGSPGADDNASGVAGLLEIAREFAVSPPTRAVRLCFFAEEEVGGLPGSTAHVAASQQQGETITAAIVLEMIGYRDHSTGSQELPEKAAGLLQSIGVEVPTRGNFIAMIGDLAASDIVLQLQESARQQDPELSALPLVVPIGALGDAARSDHAAYWKAGIPGIMVTDTANFRNPHYHQPTDLPETIDLDFAAQVIHMVLTAVRSL